MCDLIFSCKKRYQFKCDKTFLILVPSLQNFLEKFCNLFSANLKNFSMKSNLKYQIFSLVLLVSLSLGIFLIFLLNYFLTSSWVIIGWYSVFYKLSSSFSRPKRKPSHVFLKRKVLSIKILIIPFLYVTGSKLL